MDLSAAFATKIRDVLAPSTLGAWPTALESHPALARALGLGTLWVKREDQAGGNKVRGLEFLLAGFPPRSVFVTIGGDGSTHCLATARHARALGHRTALALFPQPETVETRAIAAGMDGAANLIVRASRMVTFPWAILRAWRAAHHLGRGKPRWIPGGGAEPRAVIGHFLAALELGRQVTAPPDAIVVPLGTGGTAAGLALGVAWLGWTTRVIGVRVAPWIVANRWRVVRLAGKTAALLRRSGLQFRVPESALRIEVVNGMGRGYGHPTAVGGRAQAVAAEHGLRLDPTYSAKAFGYFLQAPSNVQRAVFWLTFAMP